MILLQRYGWIGWLIAVAGLIVVFGLIVAVGLFWWRLQRYLAENPEPGAAARRRVDLTFAAAVLITLAVGLVTVLWLLEQADQADAGTERATLRAEAVKTGATIALGTGGAAYLLLAYRRHRLDEVDTRERRITELFTKAVEQLGHEKAPVRLGALYSLERLAQNNPEHRQTVIDVFCAYLRMPYSLPTRNEPGKEQMKKAATAEDGIPAAHSVSGQDPAQEELQVRQTAQRILATHLQILREGSRGGSRPVSQRRLPSPRQAFWPGIRLDLTGATLVDLKFSFISVIQAWFEGATFLGDTLLDAASLRRARFDGATFQGDARFDGTTFQLRTTFEGTTFQGDAVFDRATFQGIAVFDRATFQGDARFGLTKIRHTTFDGATFLGDVIVSSATVEGGIAEFDRATFQGDVEFHRMTMSSINRVKLAGARVLHVDNPDLNRIWPDGWTVQPDSARPSHGTLVRAEKAEVPEPAAPLVGPDQPRTDEQGSG
jgi:hypothetical protein